MTDKETLFGFLAKHGGAIISSNDLHPDLINQARASNRMYVDENSLGYIWEPPIAGRFPENESELEMFEWCYPLPVEVPEYLSSPEFFERIFKGLRDENNTQKSELPSPPKP